MKTVWTADIFPSPAAIDRKAGILYLHPKLFNELTPFQQKFVKWHEIGHYELDTNSEILADAFAFDKLAGTEFKSMRQCVGCLLQILKPENPTLKERLLALYKRALKWDYDNGNDWAGKELQRINALNWSQLEKLDAGTGSILFGLITWDKADKGDIAYKQAQAQALIMGQKTSDNVAEQNAARSTTTIVILAATILAISYILFKK